MSLGRTTRASAALAGVVVACAAVARTRADAARALRDARAHVSNTDHADGRSDAATRFARGRAAELARWWNARVDDAFGRGVKICSDRGW